MDDAVLMHECEHADELPHHLLRLRLAEAAALDDPVEERTATSLFHDEEETLRRLADLDELDEVGVAQLDEDAALVAHTRRQMLEQSRAPGHTGSKGLLAHHLDGEGPPGGDKRARANYSS